MSWNGMDLLVSLYLPTAPIFFFPEILSWAAVGGRYISTLTSLRSFVLKKIEELKRET